MGSNILYIEDNPDNMTLVKRALESRGYVLLEAPDGLTGVSVAERNDIDLILLDINLPDIDGYEVARRVRSSPKHSLAYVPIIAITANALKGDAEKRYLPAAMCTCPSRSISVNCGHVLRPLCQHLAQSKDMQNQKQDD